MKWLSSLFCVLCLTFTLTGCSGDADSGTATSGGDASSSDDAGDSKEKAEDHEDHEGSDEKE